MVVKVAFRPAWLAGVSALAVVTVGLLCWGYIAWVGGTPAHFIIDLGADVTLEAPHGGRSVALSPDGTRVVYVASIAGGTPRLFLRRFDQPQAVDLPGTEGAYSPFFSPDGRWIGFAANGKLAKISVDGGEAVSLADAANVTGASWGEDGNIVYGTLLHGLFRVPDAGGTPAAVREVGTIELGSMAPQILPGGKAILYTTLPLVPTPGTTTIDVLSLPSYVRATVVHAATSARYLAASARSGYLLYAQRASLLAVPFDLNKLETTGYPEVMLDDVGISTATLVSQFDVSRSGALVYRRASAPAPAGMTLQWLDAAGKRQALVEKSARYVAARLSPDQKRVAVEVNEGGEQSLQVYDLERRIWTRLTFDHVPHYLQAWSPDGRYIVFGSTNGLLWVRADGSGQPHQLTPDHMQAPWSFSPDGKRMAYMEHLNQAGGIDQLWTVPVEEHGTELKAGTPQQFLKSQFAEDFPAFSPDGKWLAYASSESGQNEVYVRPFPDNGSVWKISMNGGTNPVWSGAANQLLYQTGDTIMAVSYSVNGATLVPGKSRAWAAQAGGTLEDLSADGKRAVILAPVDAGDAANATHEVVLIPNFLNELRDRFPGN